MYLKANSYYMMPFQVKVLWISIMCFLSTHYYCFIHMNLILCPVHGLNHNILSSQHAQDAAIFSSSLGILSAPFNLSFVSTLCR